MQQRCCSTVAANRPHERGTAARPYRVVRCYTRAKYVVTLANCLHERETAARPTGLYKQLRCYTRAKYVVNFADCLHERGTAARRIRKNGVTKTDYSVNSMLNYILFARALSSQMSAISIARNNPFFSLDLTSCFLGER